MFCVKNFIIHYIIMKYSIHLSLVLFLLLGTACTRTEPYSETEGSSKVEVKAPTISSNKDRAASAAASSLAAAPINQKGNPQELLDHFLLLPDRYFVEGDGEFNKNRRKWMVDRYKEKSEETNPLAIQILGEVQGDYFAFGMDADEGYSGHFVSYELKGGKKAYLLVEDQSDVNRGTASFHLFMFERNQMIEIPSGLQTLEWPEVFAPKVFQQLPTAVLACDPQADVYFEPGDRHIYYSFNPDVFMYKCKAMQDEEIQKQYDAIMNGVQADSFSYQWDGRKFKKVK